MKDTVDRPDGDARTFCDFCYSHVYPACTYTTAYQRHMSGVKEQHSRCMTMRSDTKCRKESILPLMTSPVTVTVLPGEEENTQLIREKAAQALSVKPNAITALVFRKKSVDARRGQVKLHLAYTAYIGEEPPVSDASGSFAGSVSGLLRSGMEDGGKNNFGQFNIEGRSRRRVGLVQDSLPLSDCSNMGFVLSSWNGVVQRRIASGTSR